MKAFLILFLIVIHAASAQPILKAVKGEVTFFSHAPLEDITAISHQVNSFINMQKNEIAFIIPMRSFNFEKDLMEEHFNEKYVESDRYPNATYQGVITGKPDYLMPGRYRWESTGTLHLHGSKKELREEAEVVIANDTLHLETRFRLALKDYDIDIPQILFKNIADTVEVTLKASYIPYIKE